MSFPYKFPFLFEDYRRWIEYTDIKDALSFLVIDDSINITEIGDSLKFNLVTDGTVFLETADTIKFTKVEAIG